MRRSRHQRPIEFEGRPLPRPGEEVYDQGLVFDLGTALSRRRVLAILGAGAGAATAGLLARGAGALASTTPGSSESTVVGSNLTEIPEETAGPYPGDGSNGPDVLEQSGIVRSDITTSFGDASGVAEGVPATVELTIYDLANGGVPFEGAALYLWHCSREGGYSMYSEGVEDENFLRGVQIADADGKVNFTSDLPGLLRRPVAAHALRGLPGRGEHHRLDQRHRDVSARPPRGRLRRRVRRRGLRTVGLQPLPADASTPTESSPTTVRRRSWRPSPATWPAATRSRCRSGSTRPPEPEEARWAVVPAVRHPVAVGRAAERPRRSG